MELAYNVNQTFKNCGFDAKVLVGGISKLEDISRASKSGANSPSSTILIIYIYQLHIKT